MGILFKISQKTLNLPAGYDSLCPQWEEVFRVMPGEEYVDGETILDVLWRRNARAEEVSEYVDPLAYNDPGYVSDH